MSSGRERKNLDWRQRVSLARRWYQIDRLHCGQVGAVFKPMQRIPRDPSGFYDLRVLGIKQLIKIEQYHRAMVKRRLEDLAAGRDV